MNLWKPKQKSVVSLLLFVIENRPCCFLVYLWNMNSVVTMTFCTQVNFSYQAACAIWNGNSTPLVGGKWLWLPPFTLAHPDLSLSTFQCCLQLVSQVSQWVGFPVFCGCFTVKWGLVHWTSWTLTTVHLELLVLAIWTVTSLTLLLMMMLLFMILILVLTLCNQLMATFMKLTICFPMTCRAPQVMMMPNMMGKDPCLALLAVVLTNLAQTAVLQVKFLCNLRFQKPFTMQCFPERFWQTVMCPILLCLGRLGFTKIFSVMNRFHRPWCRQCRLMSSAILDADQNLKRLLLWLQRLLQAQHLGLFLQVVLHVLMMDFSKQNVSSCMMLQWVNFSLFCAIACWQAALGDISSPLGRSKCKCLEPLECWKLCLVWNHLQPWSNVQIPCCPFCVGLQRMDTMKWTLLQRSWFGSTCRRWGNPTPRPPRVIQLFLHSGLHTMFWVLNPWVPPWRAGALWEFVKSWWQGSVCWSNHWFWP